MHRYANIRNMCIYIHIYFDLQPPPQRKSRLKRIGLEGSTATVVARAGADAIPPVIATEMDRALHFVPQAGEDAVQNHSAGN